MTRDNVLFIIIGILIGFISGYFVHEAVARYQPLPESIIARVQEAQQGGAPGVEEAAAGGGVAQAGGQPDMKQILQLKSYVESHPDDADAVHQLANLEFEIKNWPRAKELYSQYMKLKPNDPNGMTDLGVCYRQTGEYQEALKLFRHAASLDPNHWQSRFNEVVVLAFDLNKPQDAKKPLEELKRLQPDNSSVKQLADEVAQRLNGKS